jgi:uncharacterized membrane protein YgdD (TMEM256/DUF423 family)
VSAPGRDPLVATGALLAAVAVALGAFGAHALKGRLDAEALGWWQTAVQYLLPHAVAVVALGLSNRADLRRPCWLLAGGAALFAATLFAMALGAPRWLGAVTPLGGAALILGWLWLAWTAVTPRPADGKMST